MAAAITNNTAMPSTGDPPGTPGVAGGGGGGRREPDAVTTPPSAGSGNGAPVTGSGRRAPIAAIKLQRRSTMDLLGGIRITKRCTNRGSRSQPSEAPPVQSVEQAEDVVNNTLLPMSASDRKHLHITINLMDKPPPAAHRIQVDDSCSVEHGGIVRVTAAMKRHEQFLEGLLLRNMDQTRLFPYIMYSIFNTSKHGYYVHDVPMEQSLLEGLGQELLVNLGNYEEMYTFIDPSLPFLPKKPTSVNAGYIVTIFRSVGNQATLDQSWATWSGANYIAAHAPPELKLQRLSLHRSCDSKFSYILVCELGEALSHLCIAREFVDKLWTRECGYTSLYVLDMCY